MAPSYWCLHAMISHYDRRLGMSDATIEAFRSMVNCGDPPDPTRLRDIQRICEQAAKERTNLSSLWIDANCWSHHHCVRPAFAIYADISQRPSLLQGNRTVGQEDTFTLTALQRITFCGFHVFASLSEKQYRINPSQAVLLLTHRLARASP